MQNISVMSVQYWHITLEINGSIYWNNLHDLIERMVRFLIRFLPEM